MASRSLSEIQESMKEVDNLPVKPPFTRPKEGDIIDENKTVVWNREEVVRLQKAYDDARSELTSAKRDRVNKLHEELYEAIQEEMRKSLSRDNAKAIYDYAYEQSHAYGYHDVFCTIDELIELIRPMI